MLSFLQSLMYLLSFNFNYIDYIPFNSLFSHTKMFSFKLSIPVFIILVYCPSSFSSHKWGLLVHNHGAHQTLESSTVLISPTSLSPKEVNVDDFGAKADGTDDTQAFKKAWMEACSSSGSQFVVPKNKVYHLKPITFSGPCHSNFIMKIYGTIKASINMSDYERDRLHWLVFAKLLRFTVEGGGTINGNGKIWWEKSCKNNASLPCQDAPTAMTFSQCMHLRVNDLTIQNSQQIHITFKNSIFVNASDLLVTAPGDSPNTDGIHVSNTRYIQIINSRIKTGDDCVSIVSGSKYVYVTNVTCGPGHGISIGSLGNSNDVERVSNVTVNRATISNATNGVRIKTWQGGSGYAINITFQNILMRNVTNPIIIDQNYCDREQACPEQYRGVRVKNVVYNNIRGTSASEVAINLNCSKTFPCQNVYLQNINLTREGGGGDAKASYANVILLATRGIISPS